MLPKRATEKLEDIMPKNEKLETRAWPGELLRLADRLEAAPGLEIPTLIREAGQMVWSDSSQWPRRHLERLVDAGGYLSAAALLVPPDHPEDVPEYHVLYEAMMRAPGPDFGPRFPAFVAASALRAHAQLVGAGE
jgi:hypothetical protein